MFVQAPLRVLVGLYPGLGMQYEMCFADLRRGLRIQVNAKEVAWVLALKLI